jgi:hypothetical protein
MLYLIFSLRFFRVRWHCQYSFTSLNLSKKQNVVILAVTSRVNKKKPRVDSEDFR